MDILEWRCWRKRRLWRKRQWR